MSEFLLQKLNQEFGERINRNPAYSLRAFSKSLGINSSTLSSLLRKKRPLTLKAAKGLMDSLQLNINDRSHVLAELAGDSLPPLPASSVHILREDILKTVVNWENYALLALIGTKDFKSDVRWIASQLKIGTGQVIATIERLRRVGLVEIHQGKLKAIHREVATTEDIPSQALREAHRQYLDKAKDALDTVAVEDRDMSGLTWAISRSQLSEAKKIIRSFRRQIQSVLENGERDCVYRLNIQLFPIQNIEMKKGQNYE